LFRIGKDQIAAPLARLPQELLETFWCRLFRKHLAHSSGPRTERGDLGAGQ
jgi:hypothetical protein